MYSEPPHHPSVTRSVYSRSESLTARITSACCHHDAMPEVEHVPASLDAGCSELPADHLAILCDRWVGRMIRQPRQQKAKAKSRGLLAACCVMQEEPWQLET
jgi:hypothetical protein